MMKRKEESGVKEAASGTSRAPKCSRQNSIGITARHGSSTSDIRNMTRGGREREEEGGRGGREMREGEEGGR